MSEEALLPPSPWTVHAGPLGRHGVGYLEVRGPAGEAICTIFPDAGLGGIGLEQARAVARLIVEARHALDEPRNDRRSEVRP